MIATNRTRRAQLRELRRIGKARKLATGNAPMSVHLRARGLDHDVIRRYSGAVSRKAPTAAAQVIRARKVRTNSRRTITVPVWVYTPRQAQRAIAAYLANGGPRKAADRAAFQLAA